MSDQQTSGPKEQPLPGAGSGGAPAPTPDTDRGGERGTMRPVDQSAQEQIAQDREDTAGYG